MTSVAPNDNIDDQHGDDSDNINEGDETSKSENVSKDVKLKTNKCKPASRVKIGASASLRKDKRKFKLEKERVQETQVEHNIEW